MESPTHSKPDLTQSPLESDLEYRRTSPSIQDEAEKYPSLPKWRKYTTVFTVSWMMLVVAYSSTSLLPTMPEIASHFSTTIEIINATNAGVLIAMGFSSFIWGLISEIVGRRKTYKVEITLLFRTNRVGIGYEDFYCYEGVGWAPGNVFYGCWIDYYCGYL
jgi:MFS family permease